MAVSERILLRQFSENRDAEAFSEIVKRYADPVYNTCRRILFDEAGAADAAQETFYQLMCNAGAVKGSLAAWLHSVATHKAIDAIRRNSKRRIRERRYAFSKSKEVNQWKDISPYIDKELEKLSPEHKEILIRYFFESKTMNEIADLNKISQPTVSRMVTAAVEALRIRLRKKGIIVAMFVLTGFIERSTLHAAPPFLLAEVGKMSLVGTTTGLLTSSATTSSVVTVAAAGSGSISALSAGTAKTVVSTVFTTIKAKVAAGIVITAIGTGAVITYNNTFTPKQEVTASPGVKVATNAEQNMDTFEKVTVRSRQPILLGSQIIGGGMVGMASQASGENEFRLADPEMTIDRFTELLVSDKLDLWKDCFVPDSQALTHLNRIMTHPRSTEEEQIQTAFNSIGQPVEIMELLESENGVTVTLLYTVYEPFSIDTNNETVMWNEGDLLEINFELVNVDEEWKIIHCYTALR
jgi:RNA polymerase sigma-70 factor (ECF subfamily)